MDKETPNAEPRDLAPAPPQAIGAVTRRQAVRTLLFGSIGTYFAAVAAGAGTMLWPTKAHGFGGVVTIGKEIDLPVGQVLRVPEGRFYLTRPDERHIIALSWHCAHLGCTVPWVADEAQFHCPCHNSTYDLTGKNTGGPAPRPLDYLPIHKDPAQGYVVDTSLPIHRDGYEPKQLTNI